ncbi:hypothetical protein GCM10009775_20030 [Microbacterium aoyamense]|uniref:Uncharacterized protein n=1 Tax=Microbacterium aoyamense TaxID=344166 RepID=A0ABN2PQQ8_9MICO|nr:hypothetical protein [Microbacterium aoyamense]
MDASTFFATRLTEQRFREFDREVTLRSRIAEHLAARRAERATTRRERRSHALAA